MALHNGTIFLKSESRGRKFALVFLSILFMTSLVLSEISLNWNNVLSISSDATSSPITGPSKSQQPVLPSSFTSTKEPPPFKFVSRDNKDPMAKIIDLTMFPDTNSNGMRPFPTGAFWTNLVMRHSKYSGSVQIQNTAVSYPIAVEPYAFRWGQNEGLQVSYPAFKRIVGSLDIQDPFFPHVSISIVEGISSREISDYDLLSTTMRFNSKSGSEGHSYSASPKIDAGFDVFVVQGSPYVTANFQNVIPKITPLSIFKEFGIAGTTGDMSTANACASIDQSARAEDWSIQLEGTQFLLVQPEGLNWIATSSEPITLSLDCASKRKLTTIGTFSGVIRLALLPEDTGFDGSAAATLLKHAPIYPNGGIVVTEYDSAGLVSLPFELLNM